MSDYNMREVYGSKHLSKSIPNGFKTLPPNACLRELRKLENELSNWKSIALANQEGIEAAWELNLELEAKLEAAEKHRKEVYLAYKDLISTRKGCMNNDYDEQLLQRAIDRLGGLAAFEGET
jgi:rRNA-processing protein FCF1